MIKYILLHYVSYFIIIFLLLINFWSLKKIKNNHLKKKPGNIIVILKDPLDIEKKGVVVEKEPNDIIIVEEENINL